MNQQWLLHEFLNSLYMKKKLQWVGLLFFFFLRSWVAFGTAVGLPKNENGGYKRSKCSGLVLVRRRKMEGIKVQECSGLLFGSRNFGVIKKLRVLQ